jgi:hypothetical protein
MAKGDIEITEQIIILQVCEWMASEQTAQASNSINITERLWHYLCSCPELEVSTKPFQPLFKSLGEERWVA